MFEFKGYKSDFGGKNGAGTYHQIINQIRPHTRYIEPFLRSGAIMLRKRPALVNIGADIDPFVVEQWKNHPYAWLQILLADALELIASLQFTQGERTVLYLDPPYPISSRSNKEEVYRYEMTDSQHRMLLEIILSLPKELCDVIISTYPNPLYEKMLNVKGWRRVTFPSRTRTYTATEVLYMNYENPAGLLHQYDYLGKNRTDRQRIKRKVAGHIHRLGELPAAERNAIIAAIIGATWSADEISYNITTSRQHALGGDAPALADAGAYGVFNLVG